LPEGTLRAALCYPRQPDAFAVDLVRDALERVGLDRLIQRMDEQDNWGQVLPMRVQQQLGFARVFLHRPAWVFMEEATDAFDPEGERQILETFNRELPNIALLNISFHPSLRPLHHRTLILSRLGETKVLFGRKRENDCAQ
jgi:putative ATP-binding cassette transporter